MRYLLAVFLLATPAFGDRVVDEFKRAEDAYETCQSTWWQSKREEALKTILSAARQIALINSPLSPSYEKHQFKLPRVNSMAENCLRITHPN